MKIFEVNTLLDIRPDYYELWWDKSERRYRNSFVNESFLGEGSPYKIVMPVRTVVPCGSEPLLFGMRRDNEVYTMPYQLAMTDYKSHVLLHDFLEQGLHPKDIFPILEL